MKSVEERLKDYEPLWENWTYTGELLGEGAMSSVFEIESTAMGLREVAALKIITVQKDMYGEVKIPENALNEIKILRELSGCSNIVNYHDSTQRKIYDDDNSLSAIDILIKMEKLEPLNESKKLSEKEVINLAKDMCTALVHSSKHGIIHRDIKPQNMFVDSDGVFKLGDFGIAKIVSGMSQYYTMNIGTMAYTAPEVRSGEFGTYDISADIYSLGLALYVFLNNGFLPFVVSTGSVHEAIAKRLSGAAFPSPANGNKNLKSIVMRACNNDRSKRYKTPQEMLDDLEMLTSDGKKFVPDPFATLDANIGIEEFVASVASSAGEAATSREVAPVPKEKPRMGGLKINMSKSPKPADERKDTSSAPTINVSPHRVPASDTPKEPEKKTGSTLRINMGKKMTPSEKMPPKTEEKETKSGESKLKSTFFSKPPSL